MSQFPRFTTDELAPDPGSPLDHLAIEGDELLSVDGELLQPCDCKLCRSKGKCVSCGAYGLCAPQIGEERVCCYCDRTPATSRFCDMWGRMGGEWSWDLMFDATDGLSRSRVTYAQPENSPTSGRPWPYAQSIVQGEVFKGIGRPCSFGSGGRIYGPGGGDGIPFRGVCTNIRGSKCPAPSAMPVWRALWRHCSRGQMATSSAGAPLPQMCESFGTGTPVPMYDEVRLAGTPYVPRETWSNMILVQSPVGPAFGAAAYVPGEGEIGRHSQFWGSRIVRASMPGVQVAEYPFAEMALSERFEQAASGCNCYVEVEWEMSVFASLTGAAGWQRVSGTGRGRFWGEFGWNKDGGESAGCIGCDEEGGL